MDSSWIDQVKRWFDELERRCLEHGVFCSFEDLKTALENWIKVWNDEAWPFNSVYFGYDLGGDRYGGSPLASALPTRRCWACCAATSGRSRLPSCGLTRT
ncbi:hypothetical protein [Streptomyces venezuelae]|uniref:hypothetical protein n=1 Tax=Streptomyces venezuelae TaxID=54571 RepID=UPI0033252515